MTHKVSSKTVLAVVHRMIPLASVFLLIIAFTVSIAQQASRKIARIEIEGLARLSADEVIATSGLKSRALFSPDELDAAGQRLVDSGLFAKVVANGVKFDKGLNEIRKRYGRTGHLDVGFGAQPEFAENANRVTYKITVKEGPQYRMGKLTIKGLSEAESEALEQSWKLKTAEVFDTSYFDRFFNADARAGMQRIFLARQAQGKGPPQVRPEVLPNRQTLTVDVTIEFKD